MKIKIYPEEMDLVEIYQAEGIAMAFVTEDGRMCHPFIKCKDFLSDVLVHVGQDAPAIEDLYGFYYDKAHDPLVSTDKTLMLFKFTTRAKETAERSVLLLNRLENIMGVENTTIEPVTGFDGYGSVGDMFVYHGPRAWVTSPTMISTFVSMVRLSTGDFDPTKGVLEEMLLDAARPQRMIEVVDRIKIDRSTDPKYIIAAVPVIRRLLTHHWKLMDMRVFDYTEFDMQDEIHDQCGLYSYANNKTPYHGYSAF